MAKIPTRRPASLLRRAIEAARLVEAAASEKRLRRPLEIAGYGFLVRNRRIASAIARLGRQGAYESKILMRTMFEIQINYAWIRLKNPHSRALRFRRFLPIERLRLLEKTATIFRSVDYERKKKQFEAERRKVRHLFRFRDSKGKMRWARSWAADRSVETRLTEIKQTERPGGKVDPFLSGMYISFSAATRGSPISLEEVLRAEDHRLVAVTQPEVRPDAHKIGAFILLVWTIEAFTEDARLKHQLRGELQEVSSAFAKLSKRTKEKWGAV